MLHVPQHLDHPSGEVLIFLEKMVVVKPLTIEVELGVQHNALCIP